MVCKGKTFRLYPDLSVTLSRKRAAFRSVKAALYQKGIQFRLRKSYETSMFESPADAEAF